MPQIYALMYLYHEGETRISDIAGLMDVGKAAASQLVDRMVQQGLVERVEDESDRRAKKIGLLPKSLAYLEKGVMAQHRQMRSLLSTLTPSQRVLLFKLPSDTWWRPLQNLDPPWAVGRALRLINHSISINRNSQRKKHVSLLTPMQARMNHHLTPRAMSSTRRFPMISSPAAYLSPAKPTFTPFQS